MKTRYRKGINRKSVGHMDTERFLLECVRTDREDVDRDNVLDAAYIIWDYLKIPESRIVHWYYNSRKQFDHFCKKAEYEIFKRLEP